MLSTGTSKAVIVSGYRVHIKDLGKLILLGDRHIRTDKDTTQYSLIKRYLHILAQNPNDGLFNIELTPHAYAHMARRKEAIKRRFPATQVLTKLKSLVANLREEEGLGTLIAMTSDPRNSEIWYISYEKYLKDMVKKALEQQGRTSSESYFFRSLADDQAALERRYIRFMARASKQLPHRLYSAIEHMLTKRLVKDNLYYKRTIKPFLQRYSKQELNDTSILQVLFSYAQKLLGEGVRHYSKLSHEKQDNIVSLVTDSFQDTIGRHFYTYTDSIANIPWICDSLNPFLAPRSVKTGVIYAGANHIKHIITFLKELNNRVGDDLLKISRAFPLNLPPTPLTHTELQSLLDIEAEERIAQKKADLRQLREKYMRRHGK